MIAKKKIIAIAVTIVATGAIGGGIATAGADTPSTAKSSSSVQVDTPDAGDAADGSGAGHASDPSDAPDAPGAQ